MIDLDWPSEIVDLEQISAHPNILVFAKSGAGKTVWATSDDKVLVLNFEPEGTLSARNMGNRAKEWTIRNWSDFEKALDWLKSLASQGNPMPFEVLVIDSITAMQKVLMRWIMDEMLVKKPHRDPDIPDMPEYLRNQLILVRKVKELNDLPVMVVYTALVRKEMDPEGNEFLFPSIQGKGYEIAQSILAMMTSYGYLFVKVRKKDGKTVVVDGVPVKDRYIMWEDSGVMQGKDRSCTLAPFTKNLTLKAVRERMERTSQGNGGNQEEKKK